jgi:DNA polymerase-3 subunit delta'
LSRRWLVSIFDVRHQNRAHRILQRALGSDRLTHACIFHGPQGVGKRTLAIRFAQLLLCERPRPVEPPAELADGGDMAWQDACGECEDCALCAAGTHPDLEMVYKELNRYHPAPEVRARKAIDLSVDVVRHFIIDRIHDRPSRGRRRVFVVRGAEEMSLAAQNALLKTLEEPPGAAFIILLTRSLDRLLPTTLSRCQHVPFLVLPREFVLEQLGRRRPDLSDAQLDFLAGYSGGRLGVALRQAEAGIFEARERLNRALVELPGLGPTGFAAAVQEDAAKLAEKIIEEMVETGMIDKAADAATTEPTRRGLMEMLAMASCLYRDALHVACGVGGGIVNGDQLDVVRRLAERMEPESITEALRAIYRTETDLAGNANVPLALESLAIRLLRLRSAVAGERVRSRR